MTKSKMKELERKRQEHNKWLRKHRMHKEQLTFDQFVDYCYGKKKSKKVLTNSLPSYTIPEHRQTTSGIKSHGPAQGSTAKPEKMVYDGERTLVGIATMHKSNMVPVFSEKEAEEISKMSS